MGGWPAGIPAVARHRAAHRLHHADQFDERRLPARRSVSLLTSLRDLRGGQRSCCSWTDPAIDVHATKLRHSRRQRQRRRRPASCLRTELRSSQPASRSPASRPSPRASVHVGGLPSPLSLTVARNSSNDFRSGSSPSPRATSLKNQACPPLSFGIVSPAPRRSPRACDQSRPSPPRRRPPTATARSPGVRKS